jgi:hypothetical protein
MMTVDGFKLFCMRAGTKRGEQICRYYISLEKENDMLKQQNAELVADNAGLVGAADAFRAEVASGNVSVTSHSDAATARLSKIAEQVNTLATRSKERDTDATMAAALARDRRKAHVRERHETHCIHSESYFNNIARHKEIVATTEEIAAEEEAIRVAQEATAAKTEAVAAAREALKASNAAARAEYNRAKRRYEETCDAITIEEERLAERKRIREQDNADIDGTIKALEIEADAIRSEQSAVATDFAAIQAEHMAELARREAEWIKQQALSGRLLPSNLRTKLISALSDGAAH